MKLFLVTYENLEEAGKGPGGSTAVSAMRQVYALAHDFSHAVSLGEKERGIHERLSNIHRLDEKVIEGV